MRCVCMVEMARNSCYDIHITASPLLCLQVKMEHRFDKCVHLAFTASMLGQIYLRHWPAT